MEGYLRRFCRVSAAFLPPQLFFQISQKRLIGLSPKSENMFIMILTKYLGPQNKILTRGILMGHAQKSKIQKNSIFDVKNSNFSKTA